MPKKGYKQSDEHRAKIAASVSAAMTGRRHSDDTKRLIGDGVQRAAKGRNWMRDARVGDPAARDYLRRADWANLLGAVFARIGIWEHKGMFPELTSVRRADFEKMTRREQQRFLKKVVVRAVPLPTPEDDLAIEIEFVDGTYWPSREASYVLDPVTGLLEPVESDPPPSAE